MRFVLQACRKIVVRGGFCSSHPEVVWHSYCLEKSARQKADIKCGVCSRKVTVGGRARREEEEEEEEEVSQRPRKQAGRRSQAVEKEEEEEEISPRAYKTARRGSGKRSRVEVESEEESSQAGRGRIERRPSGESDSEDSD